MRRFSSRPYAVEDLRESEAPVLVMTTVETERFVDIVTDTGCIAAGLPPTYPHYSDGGEIPWQACQPIGGDAWERNETGIACRSAADPTKEELAWFQWESILSADEVLNFDEWFWQSA